ncbi:MAG: winged helix DNA-binding domain-containing protein [Candidatus Methanoplasma sp.]|jgi:hypothetical protein|nr:winged helix DNA-binding domain-containing protein [Candidatus Methanoplasma sp.]
MSLAATRNGLLHIRLANQLITAPISGRPADVVDRFLAMQSQDYAMAKWAIGLRLRGSGEKDIEVAFNKGEILRTHLLRPTWHFIAPKDIRWVLDLTAPNIRKRGAYYYRILGLDENDLSRSSRIIGDILSVGVPLTRTAISEKLEAAGIHTSDGRISQILMNAELDGLICSGPREGKQFTYVLLDNAAPSSKTLHKDDALATLAARYFASRGPATVNDLAYWSGITMKDARSGAASLDRSFETVSFEGSEYIYRYAEGPEECGRSTFLLPDYDELIVGYRDRSLLCPTDINGIVDNGIAVNAERDRSILMIRGKAEGKWKVLSAKRTKASAEPVRRLSDDERSEIDSAVSRYVGFWS